ncbi:MAG: hypothetical protein ACOCR6_01765 [archaeon]
MRPYFRVMILQFSILDVKIPQLHVPDFALPHPEFEPHHDHGEFEHVRDVGDDLAHLLPRHLRFETGEWGLTDQIENSAPGHIPDDDQLLLQRMEDEQVRRALDRGCDRDAVMDVLDVSERSTFYKAKRAYAFDFPIDAFSRGGRPPEESADQDSGVSRVMMKRMRSSASTPSRSRVMMRAGRRRGEVTAMRSQVMWMRRRC